MNLLLIDRDEIGADNLVKLEDRRADHLRKVLKVEPGRRLRVGVLDGLQGFATVETVGKTAVELRLEVPEGQAPRPDLDVIVGLPRPQALHRVLQICAVMGVDRLDLVNAWRVEKSFFQSPSLEPHKVRRQLLLGAEQGRGTYLPRVECRKLLVPFVRGLEDERPTLRLIADPEAEATLEDAVAPKLDSVERFVVAIGPEGGWIDREILTFREEGFTPVRLGPWILRVENALTAGLAQLELVRRQNRSTRS